MKKLLTFGCGILLTAAAFLSGCSDYSNLQITIEEKDEIEFTAEQPVYDLTYFFNGVSQNTITEISDFSNMELTEKEQAEIINFAEKNYKDSWENVHRFYAMKFYQQKYCKGKEKFYYLIPQHTEAGENEDRGFTLEFYSRYTIWQDHSDEKTYLNENILIYDQTLGEISHPNGTTVGQVSANLQLDITLAPVSTQNISKNLSLEFGETESVSGNGETETRCYINLYAKNICIGTCYYSVAEHCAVTYEWFRSYFENNLFVE